MTRRIFNSLMYCLIATVWVVSIGCQQRDSDVLVVSEPVVRSNQKAEGIELSVEVEPAKLRLSDDFVLTLTVRKRSDFKIELPSFDDSLRDFSIRDLRSPLPKLDGDFEIVQQILRLEPTRSGKQTIIPPAVTYFQAPESSGVQGEAAEARIIEVDPIEIEVLTELTSQSPSLDQLRSDNALLELPAERSRWEVWIGLVAIVGVLIAALLMFSRLRRSKSLPSLSARDQARIELEKLIQDKWSSLDPKRYFVELTGIVRRFIERTTGIRAPEQTTEEFLQSMTSELQCADDIKLRLREFLESADLVKFAGLKPSESLIAQSLERAERFIEVEFEPNSAESIETALPLSNPRQGGEGSTSK